MILNNYEKNLTTSIALRFLNVINGLVPLISVQGVTGLVNKFALLLHKYRFILYKIAGTRQAMTIKNEDLMFVAIVLISLTRCYHVTLFLRG